MREETWDKLKNTLPSKIQDALWVSDYDTARMMTHAECVEAIVNGSIMKRRGFGDKSMQILRDALGMNPSMTKWNYNPYTGEKL